MIARCPECQTRYRIEREKVGPQGARIRCSKCTTIFRVAAPAQEAARRGDEDSATPAVTAPRPPLGTALVAESDPEIAKVLRVFLERWRLLVAVVHDGAEALLRVHRTRPDLVILGGHLPRVSAPVLCEVLRRTGELRSTPIVRVAPLDEPPGAPEFEADQTLEPGDLPEGLAELLRARKIGEPPPVAPPRPAPQAPPAPAAPPRPPGLDPNDPAVAAAERLARIIISDIILYNEEKFRRGVAAGNVGEALRAELEEASGLYRQRVPEQLRARRDFLSEELARRASKS
jgi:predicted Zn finger-like uncharacterized protein